MDGGSARRILCYGVTGSGKTTLAREIAEKTGIPWHSVDDLTFEADWQVVPFEIQRQTMSEIVNGEEWILDTAYGKWIDLPLARVELIVALDYPRWFSLARLIRRSLARAIDKRPVCNGNVETWRNMFSRESIVLWHFRSFKRKRLRIREWQGSDHAILVFKNARQTEAWLEGLAYGAIPLPGQR